MAETLKDSPTLKIVACVLGSLVLLTRIAACQQEAQMYEQINGIYGDQQQQMLHQQQQMEYQNQIQNQQMQQMMNEMNGGGYGPRSSEPQD